MADVKLFISYKTDEANLGESTGLSQVAHMLRRELDHLSYDVWMDKIGIEAGDEWDKEILTAVENCDIFLLLLSDKSDTSQWQQREVTTATNFKKIIIPVVVRGNFKANNVLNDSFNMPRAQFLDYRAGNEEQYRNLTETLSKKAVELGFLPPTAKQTYSNEAKPRNAKYATYQLQISTQDSTFLHRCKIHLAVGDMFRMRGIDVYANSENAYLQMARIFESKTISALLRYHGSHLDGGGHLLEDTVQNELNAIIGQMRWTLPLGVGTVIATSAGHPESTLRDSTQNNSRYIFHAITVSVEGESTDRTLVPAKAKSIERAVVKTLEKVFEVNASEGKISPTGTGLVYKGADAIDERTRQEQPIEKYKPITSIMLPLFASGHGGLKPEDVMKPVADGIQEFLEDVYNRGDDDKLTLTDIHVSVFSKDHIEPMQKILKKVFKEVKAPKS